MTPDFRTERIRDFPKDKIPGCRVGGAKRNPPYAKMVGYASLHPPYILRMKSEDEV